MMKEEDKIKLLISIKKEGVYFEDKIDDGKDSLRLCGITLSHLNLASVSLLPVTCFACPALGMPCAH
jgi:hypothetical protein